MSRFVGCDFCNKQVPAPYEVCVPRPSDPMDMCCVMAACVECSQGMTLGVGVTGGCATTEEWDEFCEKQGMFHS